MHNQLENVSFVIIIIVISRGRHFRIADLRGPNESSRWQVEGELLSFPFSALF